MRLPGCFVLSAAIVRLAGGAGFTGDNRRQMVAGRLGLERLGGGGRGRHILTPPHAARSGNPGTERKGEGTAKNLNRVAPHRYEV